MKVGDRVTATGTVVGVNTPCRWANVRWDDGSVSSIPWPAEERLHPAHAPGCDASHRHGRAGCLEYQCNCPRLLSDFPQEDS